MTMSPLSSVSLEKADQGAHVKTPSLGLEASSVPLSVGLVFERCCLEALKDFCTMASEISIQLEHWKHTIPQHLHGPVHPDTNQCQQSSKLSTLKLLRVGGG
jgi:hypothetical protein